MTTSRCYPGGCHCGAVRFEVTVGRHVALTCNCSICKMKGFIHIIVERADFRLVQGEGHLTTYSFNTHTARHTFCRTCGVQPFYVPRSHPEGISVNLNCLDEGHLPFRLEAFDGQNWEASVGQIQGKPAGPSGA